MTLIILEILSLEELISLMEPTICSKVRLPSGICRSTSAITSAAEREFSAFFRVMEVISQVEADVFTNEAACSDAPWASDWLELATCAAALAIWLAPSLNSEAETLSD